MSHLHHTIDYIEINVRDIAEAKQFYGDAFGWKFTDYGPDYAGIKGKGREQGGLRHVAKVTTGGPLVVLYSTDLDKTFAAAKKAGARILKKPFPFPGGRRFEFADPSGNALAVWSP